MEKILNCLTALGHPQRMAVFRLLMRRYPDSVPAGELGHALSIKPSTLSVYLSALSRAGLIGKTRVGASLRYRARLETSRRIMDYLFLDCCRGRPELCPPLFQNQDHRTQENPSKKINVLFICSGNSARSIFAESILRQEAADRFEVFSAGTKPNSALNPEAVSLLRAKDYDTKSLRAKHISEFQTGGAPEMDFIFTVCDQAANEECATWPGQPISAHWGVADPAKATGTKAEISLAFQRAYSALFERIQAFSSLPFETLDSVSLQKQVDNLTLGKDQEI